MVRMSAACWLNSVYQQVMSPERKGCLLDGDVAEAAVEGEEGFQQALEVRSSVGTSGSSETSEVEFPAGPKA